MDLAAPAFAPSIRTPEIGGFTGREGQEFVRGLVGLNIVGCDAVEDYSQYHGPGQVTRSWPRT